jgi:glyoxylase-like metal-dependent hydrolase (beta-lactamase superfamily II)
MSHGDFIKRPDTPDSREAYREIALFLDRHLGAPAPPSLRLYAMDCGHVEISDARAFSDEHAYDGRPVQGIVPCYLIRHPHGDLIWDAGFPDSMADAPAGVSFPEAHALVTVRKKFTVQLAELGLAPADIEYLSVSHCHPDHIGNANLFTQATWIVDVDERNYAFGDEARASPFFANYNLIEHAPTRLIEGDHDYDVFGDGSVVVVQAPGHTPGHTVLLVRLPEAGPLLLTGDLWQVPDARRLRTVPVGTWNRSQLLASMDKIEALARKTGARIVRQHVVEDFTSLPAFPQALQ